MTVRKLQWTSVGLLSALVTWLGVVIARAQVTTGNVTARVTDRAEWLTAK